jgi:hypothetical protein
MPTDVREAGLCPVVGIALLAVVASCAPPGTMALTPKAAPAVDVAAASFDAPAAPALFDAPPVEMDASWRGFGVEHCAYLAPAGDFIGSDGGVDVVFHFHAGQVSDRDMRASGVRGVFVACGYGVGTSGYSRAFEEPTRFGWMMKRLLKTIGAAARRDDVRLRRLALASWSAGFAAVSRILSVPEWYARTDSVILLDSLHAQYVPGGADAEGPARGTDKVDVRMLRHFIRFASDAAAGKKAMVITHSAIVPPDYASTSEATAALLSQIGVVATAADETGARNMALATKADEGGLHVRGFRGRGPRDHFDHLHLIGETLHSWVVPRWYTPAGE